MSKNYISVISYKIDFVNLPQNKVISELKDSVIYVSIRSSGFNIMIRRLADYYNVAELNCNGLKYKQNGNCWNANVSTDLSAGKLFFELKSGEILNSITPQQISFKLEDAVSKKVPVVASLNLNFRKQFGIYGKLKIEPDSVVITAPERFMSKINEIKTVKRTFEDVNSDIEFDIALQKPHNIIMSKLDNYSVHVCLSVAEYTESVVDVPVLTDSVSSGLKIKTYPDKVKVSYKVALPDYDKIHADMFEAVVDGKKACNENNTKLFVKLKKYPEQVTIIRISPEKVEYVIQKFD